MKFHIVRNGETLEKIMFLYQVKEDELKEANRHIKNFKSLIPGSKLRIPIISEAIDNDVLEMEPFVEDYYPKEIEEKEDVKELKMEEEIRLTDKDEIDNKDEIILEENKKEEHDDKEEILLGENKKEDKNVEKTNKKKDNKQHRLSYYPYYYYDPYTRRYYVYYYPYYI
ncbi:MAG: LysM domain-containing protein [Bacilli bacterium]|nr:LysM domain-containing protein [Bacilli bacterium]